ncbi:hypothetical protein DFH27DRAFT_521862 [Peziza echinospora]|nr:hypothetical protein DFH27DRAFT_521862 [Peziza echinospora]
MPSFHSSRKPRGLLALAVGFLFLSTAVAAGAAPGFIGALGPGDTLEKLPEHTVREHGHPSRHGNYMRSRIFRREAAAFPQDAEEECDDEETAHQLHLHVCHTQTKPALQIRLAANGKAECQAPVAAAKTTTTPPATTAKVTTTAPAPTTAKPTSTTPPVVVNTPSATTKAGTTAPAPTTTSKANGTTQKASNTKSDEKSSTKSAEENEETTAPPAAATQTGSATRSTTHSATTTDESPTSTSTDAPSEEKKKSSLAPVISGAIAGAIVFFAFACLAVSAFRKKREERRLDQINEEEASAKKEPMSSAAGPMGFGGSSGNGHHQMNELPQEYVIETSNGNVLGLRDAIPPPSPPPNAMVVGTPPYRRNHSNPGSQPGTPTRLGNALPMGVGRAYSGGSAQSEFDLHTGYGQQDHHHYDEDAQFYQAYPASQSISNNIGIGGNGGGGYSHGRAEAY